MTTKADIAVHEGKTEHFFHQHSDGSPSGFAEVLRKVCTQVRGSIDLSSAHLPTIDAETFRNGHGDSSYRYEITRSVTGGYNIRVLTRSLDLEKPQPVSVYGYELSSTRYVSIFEGTMSGFLLWSKVYDPDSERAVALLIAASKSDLP